MADLKRRIKLIEKEYGSSEVKHNNKVQYIQLFILLLTLPHIQPIHKVLQPRLICSIVYRGKHNHSQSISMRAINEDAKVMNKLKLIPN